MFDISSNNANEFINNEEILDTIYEARAQVTNKSKVENILTKAGQYRRLDHRELAILLEVEDKETLDQLYKTAKTINEEVFGRRVVLHTPIHLSNYNINSLEYCKLTKDELKSEIKKLQAMGHRRLILESDIDEVNFPIDYFLDCIKTIYEEQGKDGCNYRVNIDFGATSGKNYRKLKSANIGTYMFSQETYHKPTFVNTHRGHQTDYEWHTQALDRAVLEGGINSFSMGPLYGLYDFKYETIALLMHIEHLEMVTGIQPRTINISRLLPNRLVHINKYPFLVNDEEYKKIIAILRLALPYVEMIISTRENEYFLREALEIGVSHIYVGTSMKIGRHINMGSSSSSEGNNVIFNMDESRDPMKITKMLVKDGYIPSYCTACYRHKLSGSRFTYFTISGESQNYCLPNALFTFEEYILNCEDCELQEIGENMVDEKLKNVPNKVQRDKAFKYLERIRKGERDLRF